MEELAVGVDVGGSHISAGLVDRRGSLLAVETSALPRDDCGRAPPRSVASAIGRLVERLVGEGDACARYRGSGRLIGVGIGLPGVTSQPEGRILEAGNLGWTGSVSADAAREIRGVLSSIDVEVRVDNDANLAALGEWYAGAGRGARCLLCVTIGTGIGGGIVVDGRLFRGAMGYAGEIGHLKVAREGRPCSCGGRGCLETVASGTAIATYAQEAVATRESAGEPVGMLGTAYRERRLTARDVFDAARAGDRLATAIVKEAAEHLGFALAGAVNLLNPDVIVLGGSVSLAGDVLLHPVRDAVARYSMAVPGSVVRVEAAGLGPHAAIVGGAALWFS